MDVPDYTSNNYWALAWVALAFLVGVAVAHMIRRAMNLPQFSLWFQAVHLLALPLVASSMGPLVECRMHDFWGLWLPLGLILEQAVILELGVPSISTRLRGMLPEG